MYYCKFLFLGKSNQKDKIKTFSRNKCKALAGDNGSNGHDILFSFPLHGNNTQSLCTKAKRESFHSCNLSHFQYFILLLFFFSFWWPPLSPQYFILDLNHAKKDLCGIATYIVNHIRKETEKKNTLRFPL